MLLLHRELARGGRPWRPRATTRSRPPSPGRRARRRRRARRAQVASSRSVDFSVPTSFTSQRTSFDFVPPGTTTRTTTAPSASFAHVIVPGPLPSSATFRPPPPRRPPPRPPRSRPPRPSAPPPPRGVPQRRLQRRLAFVADLRSDLARLLRLLQPVGLDHHLLRRLAASGARAVLLAQPAEEDVAARHGLRAARSDQRERVRAALDRAVGRAASRRRPRRARAAARARRQQHDRAHREERGSTRALPPAPPLAARIFRPRARARRDAPRTKKPRTALFTTIVRPPLVVDGARPPRAGPASTTRTRGRSSTRAWWSLPRDHRRPPSPRSSSVVEL